MQTRSLFPRLALAVLPVAAVGAIAWTPADHRDAVSGTFTATYASREVHEVGDAPGHVIGAALARGTNRSTGSTEYMPGASVVNVETHDLIRGNGPHQGYSTFALGPDTTVSKWNGKVTTVLGADQRPITTFEGTWTKSSGTGRYAGASGHGSYKGRMTSDKEYLIQWTGEMSGVKVAGR
ncbi:MAG: hypothetical protein H0T50_02500 [Gemmatimonadales bacterium]|nr:hypothetical protein [Gemmatimonadales bacterium]